MSAPISAYFVTLGAALFSAAWALIFHSFYSHIDDPWKTGEPQGSRQAA
jgi:hypothetical protein